MVWGIDFFALIYAIYSVKRSTLFSKYLIHFCYDLLETAVTDSERVFDGCLDTRLLSF